MHATRNLTISFQILIWTLGMVISFNVNSADNAHTAKIETAVFAGGCFWCMEPPFDILPGVLTTTSGYTGGQTENPNYKEVSSGLSGHYEAVQVTYDPARITYAKLLETFWKNIDPFDDTGQFCDKGGQYKAVIFYRDEEQRRLAEASKASIEKKFAGKTVATSIIPAGKFYPAEDYHQNYSLNNPFRYKLYRTLCKRDWRLHQVWGN
jgi:peptide-methionine (S)-S-oxide reductase